MSVYHSVFDIQGNKITNFNIIAVAN